MQTIKIKYKSSDNDLILNYLKQYSSLLHYVYNRILENLSQKEIKDKIKTLNNISLLDSWFIQSSIYDVKTLISNRLDNSKIIFGGKKNFFDRMKGKLSKEEYQLKKLSPLYSIGEVVNKSVKANRKFHLENDLEHITFKPNRTQHIDLELIGVGSNRKQILNKLYLMQENHEINIAYKLDLNYVYISFDEAKLSDFKQVKPISNRVLALDLNPNYIGWSIVDWKNEIEFKLINSGVYSFKQLNDNELEFKNQHLSSSSKERIYISNKRKFESIEVCKNLINKALHYKVELVSIEDLNIKSKNHSKGKSFNKLVNNQWIRNDFVNNLTKRCNIFKIKLLKVKPEYSSFIGNILFRSLNKPDMVLASIEIGRRAYEFYNQYVTNKNIKQKNIVQPNILKFNDLIIKSLEEFNINESFKDFIEMYYFFKKMKFKYRLSLNQLDLKFSKFCSNKSHVSYYNDYKCYNGCEQII